MLYLISVLIPSIIWLFFYKLLKKEIHYLTIISLFIFVCILLNMAIVCYYKDTNSLITKKVKTIELKSINDNFSNSGSFFLGTGTVESESYYYYYIKTGTNTYKQNKLDATNVEIVEDSLLTKAYLIKYSNMIPEKYANWVIRPHSYTYKFYVPSNTIKQNYTFDLK
jgi:hypothetical protein